MVLPGILEHAGVYEEHLSQPFPVPNSAAEHLVVGVLEPERQEPQHVVHLAALVRGAERDGLHEALHRLENLARGGSALSGALEVLAGVSDGFWKVLRVFDYFLDGVCVYFLWHL